jgi:hypothetical protein
MASESASATARAVEKLPSVSALPIFSLSVTNSSVEIAPDFSAFSPYWMPTLSRLFSARMPLGARALVVVP